MSNNATDDYFKLRRVSPDLYNDVELQAYVRNRLPSDKSSLIVDFGCGLGQTLRSLAKLGYTNLLGVEINDFAVDYCVANGLRVVRSLDQIEGLKAKFVLMSHVLEHIPKQSMQAALVAVRSSLAPDGCLLVCVPNAQSATGAYWAYEDFTHEFLFTSGSLYYIAKLAGFSEVTIIDADCTEGVHPLKAAVVRFFLMIYKCNYRFWNKVTRSSPHLPSEDVFSFEVKALCR
jgi:SAM-dependent methyltransferase